MCTSQGTFIRSGFVLLCSFGYIHVRCASRAAYWEVGVDELLKSMDDLSAAAAQLSAGSVPVSLGAAGPALEPEPEPDASDAARQVEEGVPPP